MPSGERYFATWQTATQGPEEMRGEVEEIRGELRATVLDTSSARFAIPVPAAVCDAPADLCRVRRAIAGGADVTAVLHAPGL